MKKFSFYILILIILVGLLSPVININAQTSGKCYWHSDRFTLKENLLIRHLLKNSVVLITPVHIG